MTFSPTTCLGLFPFDPAREPVPCSVSQQPAKSAPSGNAFIKFIARTINQTRADSSQTEKPLICQIHDQIPYCRRGIPSIRKMGEPIHETVVSSQRSEPGSFNLQAAPWPASAKDESVDPSSIASEVVASLNAALAKKDHGSVADLFPGGWVLA